MENLEELSIYDITQYTPIGPLPIHIQVLKLDSSRDLINYQQLLKIIEPLEQLERIELLVDEGMKSETTNRLARSLRSDIKIVVHEIEFRYDDFDSDGATYECGCEYCLDREGSLRLEHPYIARKGFAVRDYA